MFNCSLLSRVSRSCRGKTYTDPRICGDVLPSARHWCSLLIGPVSRVNRIWYVCGDAWGSMKDSTSNDLSIVRLTSPHFPNARYPIGPLKQSQVWRSHLKMRYLIYTDPRYISRLHTPVRILSSPKFLLFQVIHGKCVCKHRFLAFSHSPLMTTKIPASLQGSHVSAPSHHTSANCRLLQRCGYRKKHLHSGERGHR